MQGVMTAAAERAGIPDEDAREIAEEVRREEWNAVVRHLADRMHEALIDRRDAPPLV